MTEYAKKDMEKKRGFFTNLFYQFRHRSGKWEWMKEKEQKHREKTQYLYHLDLVIYPNRINIRIMFSRV